MRRRASVLFGCAVAVAGCGARTQLAVNDEAAAAAPAQAGAADAAADGCAVAPLCGGDFTRGTWRLESAQHEPLGYLFMFDGRGACNGRDLSYLLDVTRGGASCTRNADYEIDQSSASYFFFSANTLGGSFDRRCGQPDMETMRLELRRSVCDESTYELVVHDSVSGSIYELTAVATRCRCDIGWTACADPVPDDPCAP